MTFRDGTLVDWHPWGPEPFEAAARDDEPLLLSLTAPWCEWCARMDEEAYSDPKLAANVAERFVPVRVDVDRRPRVRERYNMGGFPTTAFLTPDGEVLSGATYLGVDGLRQVLERVRETWDAEGADAGRVPRALSAADAPAGEVTAAVEAHMVEQVAAAFDGEFGGWGSGAKFPLPRTIEFACKRDRDRATRTLEAVRTHLQDTYDGGFYRFAETRRWGEPHREKLTDDNAALLRAFTTGYLYTGENSYRRTAERTVDYLTTELWTGEAFAASQAAGDYYLLEPSEREATEPPAVDETVLADRNGLAAEALFRFAAVTDHDSAVRYAERALEHVLATLVDEGRGARFDGATAATTGLLVDHARLLGGLTAAAQVTGPDGWLEPARRVADDAVDRLADDGGFLDGEPTDAGLLAHPLRPLETNAEMADGLLELWVLTGEERYRRAAVDALSSFAGAHDRMGVEAAGYAAACARAHYDPLVIRTPPAGTELHRAALRVADHEKVVVPGDRETAVVVRGGEETAPAATPEALLERAAGPQ
ncbi:thioredoxin domain-containing protein [Halobacteriales archaeon QS_8_69_73]|nr:MAG: thioredoxin domain-containing protein [Halobacteriales archaeon QS_8_69_73]